MTQNFSVRSLVSQTPRSEATHNQHNRLPSFCCFDRNEVYGLTGEGLELGSPKQQSRKFMA